MNPMITAAALAVTLSATGGASHAAAKTHPAAHKPADLICPVSGDHITSVRAAAGHTTYKGKTYYFCCPMCKPKFDKNPAKYVRNAAHGKYEKM